MDSTAEWKWQRKDSVNLKTNQEKLSDVNRGKKIEKQNRGSETYSTSSFNVITVSREA